MTNGARRPGRACPAINGPAARAIYDCPALSTPADFGRHRSRKVYSAIRMVASFAVERGPPSTALGSEREVRKRNRMGTVYSPGGVLGGRGLLSLEVQQA
jgi:hypothetical protein